MSRIPECGRMNQRSGLILVSSLSPGPDKGAHYHELFLRNKRHLAHRIHRMKIKGKGARKPAKPSEEPNFYQKPFLPAHVATITSTNMNQHHQHVVASPNHQMPPMPPLGVPFPSLYAQLLSSTAASAAYHQSVSSHGSALDQLLAQCPTWVPPSLASTLPPHVLSSLVKEGVDAAALLNQFRG